MFPLTPASWRQVVAPEGRRGDSEEAPSTREGVGWGLGDSSKGAGATRWEKSNVSSAGGRAIAAVVCRSPPSGTPPWRDPASRSPRLLWGNPSAATAQRRRLVPLAPARRLPALGPCVFFAGPALSTPGSERKLWRWFPHSSGRKSPW